MQSNKIIKALCVIMSVMFVFASSFVAEAKSNEDKLDDINNKISQGRKDLDKLKQEKASTKDYVNKLMGNIELVEDKVKALEDQKANLQKEINAIEKKINETNVEIEKMQKEVEAKQKEMEATYSAYCQRLRAIYVSGNVSTLEILLESGDMGDILTRAEMVKSISAQDSKTLRGLMDKMEEINKEKQELENKKLELDNDKKNLDERKAKLQSSLDEINQSKADLKAQIAECNSKIKSINDKEFDIQNTLDEDIETKNRIEDEIKNASNDKGDSNNGDYVPSTGQLAYPTSIRKITAGYPNYKNGSYHGGVDFACPTGTPVYACDNGYVAIAKTLNYSYGYHILINHDGGISTLYAHNSQLFVKQGDYVKKGQLIAKTGSTGNSTGPHLHFEVRRNGNRVNPLSYLG